MTLKTANDGLLSPSYNSKHNKGKDKKNEESTKRHKSNDRTKHNSSEHSVKTKENRLSGDESSSSKISPSSDIESRSYSRRRVCRRLVSTMSAPFIPVTVPQCNYPYNVNVSYPVSVDDWNTVMAPIQYAPIPSCPYNVPYQPVQVIPMLPSPICPYSGALIPPQMCYTPVLTMPITEIPMSYGYDSVHCSPEQIVPNEQNVTFISESAEETMYEAPEPEQEPENDDESFLRLNRNLFPTARMLDLDPNPIIDELCKLKNLSNNVPWILDLEFGVQRVPSSRPVPIYDVKFNSIHCRNAPNAIYPEFESCTENFQRVFLFYYDTVISTWYRGFVFMNSDNSVENFQSWLLWGMHLYGMCWP